MYDAMLKFLASSDKNSWCESIRFKIYFRKSKRMIRAPINFTDFPNTLGNILDIANVEVFLEYQKKGIFTLFVNELMNNIPLDGFYIENVLNSDLERSLREYKWNTISGGNAYPPSFLKLKE